MRVLDDIVVDTVDKILRGNQKAAELWSVLKAPIAESREPTIDEWSEIESLYEQMQSEAVGELLVDLRRV